MIDIGANLTNKRFEKDLPQVLLDAQNAGVSQIIVTGTCIESSQAAIELCKQHSGLYATAGIHPHDATSCDTQALETLSNLLKQPEVIAAGECGLDFNRNFSPPATQIQAFESQLQLAADHQKPLFLHEREAFDSQLPMLEKYRDKLSGAVVHCFTGNKEALLAYLSLDLHIGITGWVCDERRGQTLCELIPLIPDEKLLIETDAPYLTPRTLTGKKRKAKNTPANLPHIAEFIAKLRNQSLEEVINITQRNANQLFKLHPDN